MIAIEPLGTLDAAVRVPGSKSGGTGLGLAIARAFVEAHGGFIRASNDPDGGLKITMIFKAGK